MQTVVEAKEDWERAERWWGKLDVASGALNFLPYT